MKITRKPVDAVGKASKLKHDVLLNVSALTGAVAGATTGSIAGPPGIVAGGLVGAAVGLMAGSTLEDDEARFEKHDRVLDKEIGVSGGEMGATPESKRPAPPDEEGPRSDMVDDLRDLDAKR